MKTLIILAHLVLGVVLVLTGFTYANRALDLAFRSDFSPKSIERSDIFSSPQAYINKCVELGGNISQCEKEYEQTVKNIENSNRETTQYARSNLVSTLTPIILVILIGVISILATVGFWRNKKWGALALLIASAGVLVGTAYWAFAILIGFGEIVLLVMPVAAVGWLMAETVYLKRHWAEFI